jgi:hypothetical protein
MYRVPMRPRDRAVGRTVTAIKIDEEGHPSGVVHERSEGGERVEARAPVAERQNTPPLITFLLSRIA